MNEWGPTSWRSLPAEQQPEWPDEHALEQSLKVLSTLPPLVFAGEARALRSLGTRLLVLATALAASAAVARTQ